MVAKVFSAIRLILYFVDAHVTLLGWRHFPMTKLDRLKPLEDESNAKKHFLERWEDLGFCLISIKE